MRVFVPGVLLLVFRTILKDEVTLLVVDTIFHQEYLYKLSFNFVGLVTFYRSFEQSYAIRTSIDRLLCSFGLSTSIVNKPGEHPLYIPALYGMTRFGAF